MSVLGDDITSLVSELEDLTTGSSKIKTYKQDYCLNTHSITRWKFKEFNYYSKIKLPISSRGLFIDNKNSKICIRGYDKFFNIDEVSATRLPNIKSNTKGPFNVTIKENGCILFISGLSDGTLLVSSKNNLYVADSQDKKIVSKDHAKEGYQQLLKLFNNDASRLQQLALELYTNNLTAVLELCDDSFEEHVVAYNTLETAGLYLHGLNRNTIQFNTLPINQVYQFAEKYGFKKVDSFQFETFEELFTFLNSEDSEYTYKGREIEGYVIRCFEKNLGNDFFFKFKFEEPYLLYRQLREVTNEYINTKERVFFFKKNKKLTNMYLDYVIPILDNDEKLCEDYVVNRKGIIKLRTDFFKQAGLLDKITGTLDLKLFNEMDDEPTVLPINKDTKYIIVPVSILGLGKTTFTACLLDLYPKSISTVSSDLCRQRKNNIPVLMESALKLLSEGFKVVVFDRNNHMLEHRELIIKELQQQKEMFFSHQENIQLVALPFVDMESMAYKSDRSLENILKRGNEHPTIKAEKLGVKGVTNILNRFVKDFKAFNFSDNEGYDLSVRSILNFNNLTEQIIDFFDSLNIHYGIQNVLQEPILDTLAIKNKVKLFEESLQLKLTEKRLPKVLYFGVNINPSVIEKLIENIDYPSEFKPKGEYHITVAFSKGKEQHEAFNYYFNEFTENLRDAPFGKIKNYYLPKSYKFKPECIVYDLKAMAIRVSPVEKVVIGNEFPHITISVNGVPPVYSNELIKKVYNKKLTEGTKSIDFAEGLIIEGDLFAFLT
ncbi:hypothetical protein QEN19_003618 [Hanseniaspora menglaensis]